jgi:hypothetical protein
MVDLRGMSKGAEPVDPERPDVDVSLIDEMLRLSPVERLRQNDSAAALAVALQEAFLRRDAPWPKPER